MSPVPRIVALGNGQFLAHHDDAQQLAWAVADGSVTWVFVEGRSYRIGQAAAPKRTAQASGHDDQRALSAPMPATVAAVHVTAGQPVERGDVLLTLEAMKMELPISAPRAGVVKSVTCKAGDLVQPGVPLVELD